MVGEAIEKLGRTTGFPQKRIAFDLEAKRSYVYAI
jgi:hypothetical protein